MTGFFPVNLGQLQTLHTCTVATKAEVYGDDGGSETLKMSIPDPRYLGQNLTLLAKILLSLPTWQSI